jgi:hypothetical protein
MTYIPKKVVRPATEDQINSVSLFDANSKNRWGEMLCVAAAILPRQVDEHWNAYLAGITEGEAAAESIRSEADLSPMQRVIIPLVEDGYTLRIRNTWSLTYGKGDHRVTVHHDGTTSEYTAAAEG